MPVPSHFSTVVRACSEQSGIGTEARFVNTTRRVLGQDAQRIRAQWEATLLVAQRDR